MTIPETEEKEMTGKRLRKGDERKSMRKGKTKKEEEEDRILRGEDEDTRKI